MRIIYVHRVGVVVQEAGIFQQNVVPMSYFFFSWAEGIG